MNLLKDLTGLSGSHDKNAENWFITIERAEGVEDKDRWSKADTYVMVEFGGKHVKTHTINNSRTPFWNETFDLKLEPDHVKDLHVKLMDDDFGKDDPIGVAIISKEDLPFRSGDERYLRVPVFRKEQTTAIIVLRIKKMSGSDLSSNAPLNQSETTYQQQQQPQYYQRSQNYQQPQGYQQSSYQQQPYQQSSYQQQSDRPPDVSSATYPSQQYPSSNFSSQQGSSQQGSSQQGQPQTYFSRDQSDFSQEKHHHHQYQQGQPPVSSQQPFSQSSQQPYMGSGNVQTNYEDQQKRY